VLAIAGAVAWGGYLLFVYGLSQLAGQNYSIGDLAIPGKFTLGNPAPDGPASGASGVGTSTSGPCTAAQIAAGWVMASNGKCTKGSSTVPGSPNKYYYCRDNTTGANVGAFTGKCPKGSTKTPLQS